MMTDLDHHHVGPIEGYHVLGLPCGTEDPNSFYKVMLHGDWAFLQGNPPRCSCMIINGDKE